MKKNISNIIGLRELRENINVYLAKLEKGQSFIVVKKSKPVFRISAVDDADELWEPVIDFTKIKTGGIALKQLLSRL